MSEDAHDLALKKLTRLRENGYDPREVIEQSIFMNWQGLFEVKTASRQTERDRMRADVLRKIKEEEASKK